jgi:hypothetical protein
LAGFFVLTKLEVAESASGKPWEHRCNELVELFSETIIDWSCPIGTASVVAAQASRGMFGTSPLDGRKRVS